MNFDIVIYILEQIFAANKITRFEINYRFMQLNCNIQNRDSVDLFKSYICKYSKDNDE